MVKIALVTLTSSSNGPLFTEKKRRLIAMGIIDMGLGYNGIPIPVRQRE